MYAPHRADTSRPLRFRLTVLVIFPSSVPAARVQRDPRTLRASFVRLCWTITVYPTKAQRRASSARRSMRTYAACTTSDTRAAYLYTRPRRSPRRQIVDLGLCSVELYSTLSPRPPRLDAVLHLGRAGHGAVRIYAESGRHGWMRRARLARWRRSSAEWAGRAAPRCVWIRPSPTFRGAALRRGCTTRTGSVVRA